MARFMVSREDINGNRVKIVFPPLREQWERVGTEKKTLCSRLKFRCTNGLSLSGNNGNTIFIKEVKV